MYFRQRQRTAEVGFYSIPRDKDDVKINSLNRKIAKALSPCTEIAETVVSYPFGGRRRTPLWYWLPV
jgi:hypothetical protein